MDAQVICIPYQLDVGWWGYAQGPQGLLDAGLIELLHERGLGTAEPIWIDLPRALRSRDIVTNLGRIASMTATGVSAALDAGALPIVLQGDCSHAVGAIGGLSQGGEPPGVVWIDAHADLHTYATTGSGYVGGMPYAVALGWDLDDWRLAGGLTRPVRASAAALIGGSDIDPEEDAAMTAHGIGRVDADQMDATGAAVAAALSPRHSDAETWYLHVDVDVAGPDEAPGGLTPTTSPPSREAIIAAIAATVRAVPVGAIGIATYNPSGDPTGRGARFALDVLDAALPG